MSKTNYYMIAQKKQSSFDELSKLIATAIDEERFINKTTLIPKIKAIISAFKVNLNSTKYNKLENPSDAARRIRTIEKLEIENRFWKATIKELIGNDIEKYYPQLKQELITKGF